MAITIYDSDYIGFTYIFYKKFCLLMHSAFLHLYIKIFLDIAQMNVPWSEVTIILTQDKIFLSVNP